MVTVSTRNIDLTFVNEMAENRGLITQWRADEENNADSDHHAISFAITQRDEEVIQNLITARFNWKSLDKEKYQTRLRELFSNENEKYETDFEPILLRVLGTHTKEELDRAATFVQDAMTEAATVSTRPARPSKASKPWWNEELSILAKERRRAKAEAKREAGLRGGCCSVETANTLKHARAVFDRKFKEERKGFTNERIANANATNYWGLVSWTRRTRQYRSPPIRREDSNETAITHPEKCNILRATLLPPPPMIPNPPQIDLDARPEDIPWKDITRNEVRTAVFKAAPDNAPGPSGITGRAIHSAWPIIHEEIFQLIRACTYTGHHPAPFRQSICVILQKPKKPDYSSPKAYRPIQLLEVLGKVIERIQAERLAHYAVEHKLIPPSHFGGLKSKSAEDALLASFHDIEAACNLGLATSVLTFDISGFFNNVSHPVLLETLRTKNIPLPLVKWVESFLSERQTAICLDGIRDEMKPTRTGIPQGSCVSPILAAYLTSPLSEAIHESTKISNLPTEMAKRAKNDKAVDTKLWLYVDDGKLHVASEDVETNSLILGRALTIVESWMKQRGMKLDPDKSELIHHSRSPRHKVQCDTPVMVPSQEGPPRRIDPSPTIRWLGVIFDTGLSFDAHIKMATEKAKKAADAFEVVGNSISGLDPIHRRLLFIGAIRPMLTYASTVWWRGTKRPSRSPIQSPERRPSKGHWSLSNHPNQRTRGPSVYPTHPYPPRPPKRQSSTPPQHARRATPPDPPTTRPQTTPHPAIPSPSPIREAPFPYPSPTNWNTRETQGRESRESEKMHEAVGYQRENDRRRRTDRPNDGSPMA